MKKSPAMQVEVLSYEIFNVAKNSWFNTVELTKAIVKTRRQNQWKLAKMF